MTAQWIPVCQEDDLQKNMGICAKIQDRQVAIFKVERSAGETSIYAIDNHCPFSKANVLSRGIVGDLKERTVVASPVYKQHFDLQTGECLEAEDVKLPTYKVRNLNGVIEVAA